MSMLLLFPSIPTAPFVPGSGITWGQMGGAIFANITVASVSWSVVMLPMEVC